MKVSLLRYTPEPEITIAIAARQSYSAEDGSAIMNTMKKKTAIRLLHDLYDHGHDSPFEFSSFVLSIDGISRSCSHQLVRARLASYVQQSMRYVKLDGELDWVVPPSILNDPRTRNMFGDLMQRCQECYKVLLNEGVPAEDARFVLPNATPTAMVMTMNARELIHSAGLRMCLRAQWEIRELFTQIRNAVHPVAPYIAALMRPKCFRLGYCDESEANWCNMMPLRRDVVDG